jgi:hypothetical protein
MNNNSNQISNIHTAFHEAQGMFIDLSILAKQLGNQLAEVVEVVVKNPTAEGTIALGKTAIIYQEMGKQFKATNEALVKMHRLIDDTPFEDKRTQSKITDHFPPRMGNGVILLPYTPIKTTDISIVEELLPHAAVGLDEMALKTMEEVD